MSGIAVLDDYDGSISKLDCWKSLTGDFQIRFFSAPVDPADLADFEVVVANRERTLITRQLLSHAKSLKHLALTGRLSGQADLEALKAKGIAVSFTEGSGQAASELTIALILGITKGIADRHQFMRTGGWQSGLGSSLAGKTLGVLGLGRIGTKIALFGKLMEMTVVSWGPTEDQGRSAKLGLERLELDDCLRRSDILAVCLRLSDQTRGILGADKLSLLRDGTRLVNTSRAEIIERDALYTELRSGRISGAFDVFHTEPLPADDSLRGFPNVLLSPHMGYVTREVYGIFFPQVVDNIIAWKAGRAYRSAL